jgi:CubicO group peptidase (beta-lactamase class C family)
MVELDRSSVRARGDAAPARRMSAATALAALLLALAPASAAPGAPNVAPAAQIDAHFKEECSAGRFAGVILVVADGREIYSGACGEADPVNRIQMSRQTRFKIFSTSKLMTALAVMRLVEEGKMALDAPVMRYLPTTPRDWSAVTIRQLLNHTSGIRDLEPELVRNFSSDFHSAVIRTFAQLTPEQAALDAPPGTHFAYNNFGFDLLAMAVEQVAGEPFPVAVKAMVFDPAGMRTASYQPEAAVLGHPADQPEDGLALGYVGAPRKLVAANEFAFIQLGAGAVRASADDFVALNHALATGAVIKPATLRLMAADPVTPPPEYPVKGRRFGLGMFVSDVDGVRLEGHTGGNNGYISDFERTPDGRYMMIALSARGFTSTVWLRRDLAALVAARS